MGIIKVKDKKIYSSDIAARCILTRPPEPPSNLLVGDPTNSIYVGRTEVMNVPFHWNFENVTNPHIAVVGITGSGKSYFIKTFLTRASFIWRSNALIIDWAGEYKDWVREAGGRIMSLGKGSYINLLDLAGMRPVDRIKQVIRTLEILTDISRYPEQKRLIEEAIEKAYVKAGFRLAERNQKDALGNPLKPPTLKDVVKNLENKLSSGTYEFPIELENAIYKVKKFTREGEDFFAQQSTISLNELISSGLVDLDLSALPDETFRAMAALSILQFLKEKMRAAGWAKKKGIRLIIVLDEAWKISKDENSDAVMIVREGRKYQFALLIASQNPTDINEAIFSNVGTNFILRIKFEKFLNYLQNSLNFSDYIRDKISRLGVGQAAVNMALHTSTPYPETFMLARIEGEEPIVEYFVDVPANLVGEEEIVGKTLTFERTDLRKRLRDYGLPDEKIERISSEFEKHNRHMDVVEFVILLERMGLERDVITDFLKDLGVEDSVIVNILSEVDYRKMGVRGESTEVELSD
ncbi:MAG: ATP-binding protein [Candidatus Asgardarchaeia archaeon]